jgi:orotate phosphoribosyltransferase
MTRAELAEQIYEVSHRTGTFRLRSGIESHEYFDKYRFESDLVLLKAICAELSPLVPETTQMLAGLELGGVPIATVLGQISGLPVVFVRKTAKEYGTGQLAEGAPVAGQILVVIEDVVTSGGQIVQSVQDLRSLGAIVGHAICVIDGGTTARASLAAAGIELRTLFQSGDLRKSN